MVVWLKSPAIELASAHGVIRREPGYLNPFFELL